MAFIVFVCHTPLTLGACTPLEGIPCMEWRIQRHTLGNSRVLMAILAAFSSVPDIFLIRDPFLQSLLLLLQADDTQSIIMRTLNNETYYCQVPSESRGKFFQNDAADEVAPRALLSQFFSTYPCIFKVEGYWTYELCHDQHIRQFRAEIVAPRTTRIVTEYYLGRFENIKDVDPEETKTQPVRLFNCKCKPGNSPLPLCLTIGLSTDLFAF